MKRIFFRHDFYRLLKACLGILFFTSLSFNSYSQASCAQAIVFCGSLPYTYAAGVCKPNETCNAEPGPCYSCLQTTPNPAWFYMQIGDPGKIVITISNSNNYDIDFICWGPLTSPTGDCLAGLTCPKVVSCSYSLAATEICTIPNGLTGQFYMLMITNYHNLATNISFVQSNYGQVGAGTTNCNIVINCSILSLSANPTACNTLTSTYDLNGVIEFTNPPATGVLQISDVTASPAVTINLLPPFVSPLPFTLPGIPCDGLTHTIQAEFLSSTNPCTFTRTYVAPPTPCPAGTISGGGKICDNGQQANVSINVTGAPPPYNFTYAISGVPQTRITNYTAPLPYILNTSTPGTYTLTEVSTASCSGSFSGSADVILVPRPAAPAAAGSTFFNCGPGVVSLEAVNIDPNIRIDWYNSPSGGASMGSGNIFLTPFIAVTSDFYAEAVDITTPGGCPSLNRTHFIAEIRQIPNLTNSPANPICSGSQFNVILQSNVGGADFTWTASCNPVSSVSGFTASQPTPVFNINDRLDNLTNADASVTYAITPQANSCTGPPASYSVIVHPVVLVTNPAPPPICSGTSFNMTLTSNLLLDPPDLSFTWTATCNPPGSVTGFPLNPVTGNSISDVLVNSSSDPAMVTYVITPFTNGCLGSASNYSVTVNPSPHLTNTPPPAICSGSQFTISLQSDVAGADFTWTAICNPASSVTGFTASQPTPVIVIDDLLTNVTLDNADVTYFVVPRANNCMGQASGYTVTVHPVAAVNAINNQVICSGDQTQAVPLSSNVTTLPVDYTWTLSCDPGIPVCPGNGSSNPIPPVPISNTDIVPRFATYTITPSVAGCQGTALSTYKVQVNPRPVVTNASLSQVICSGTSTSAVTLTANVNPSDFVWTATASSPSITGFQVSGTNQIPVQTIANSSAVQGFVNYHIIPSSQIGIPCAGVPADYKVFVNPLPVPAIVGPNQVCHNQTAVIYSSSNVPGHSYNWVVNGAISFTGNPGNSIQVDWGPGPSGTVQVTETDHNLAPNCSSSTQPYNVIINPSAAPVITASPATISPCGNSQVTYSLGPALTGHSYAWTITGGAPAGSTGSSISVTWGNTNPGIVDVVETIHYAPGVDCSAQDLKTITLTLIPDAAGLISGPQEVCRGLSKSYQVPVINNADGYLWTYLPAAGVVTPAPPAGTTAVVAFDLTASNGNLSVQGTKTGCASGPASSLPITVHPLPDVHLTACNDLVTTTTSRPFTLKGGLPLGPNGSYYIDGTLSPTAVFTPSAFPPNTAHSVTYLFTDFHTCKKFSDPVVITVKQGSPSITCPAAITDPRDLQSYPAYNIGGKCWMLSNLNYGNPVSDQLPQSDNCIPEKYCQNGNCSTSGGLYQWDELMQYQAPAPGQTVQGLCPPEWHIPTEAEWQNLINTVAGINPGEGLAGSYLKDPIPTNGFHVLLDGIYFLNDTWAYTSGNPLTATMFWTSGTSGISRAVARGLNVYSYSVSLYTSSRANSLPVRCVKD